MPKYAMAIDLARCMGCRACMVACKAENNTGRGVFWMYVFRFEEGEYPETHINFMPRPCQHCENAPCVKVCPVGARFIRDDGIVVTDADRCIGCRYCQVACPYGVNCFNWKDPRKNQYYDWDSGDAAPVSRAVGNAVPPNRNPDFEKMNGGRRVAGSGHSKGVMEKCTFCVHRVEKGHLPACVANCPVGVYSFGDLEDPTSDIRRKLRESEVARLLEETGTRPKVFYLNRPLPRGEVREVEPLLAEVKL